MKNSNTILVVDDNNKLRQLFVSCLRQAGYEVTDAATGLEGLRLAQKHCPDLVLLDVQLPDINGMEVCRRIKTDPALKDVLVALCSGEATESEDKIHGLQTGADEYLIKPFGLHELLARVQALVRLRNITAALRASEEHHRRLIDILPNAVFLIHPDGRLLAGNSQAAAMLGYDSTEDLINRSVFEFIPEEEHERMRTDIADAQMAGIIRDIEYTMLKKNGTAFRVELSATMCLGIGTQPAGLLSVVRDITERKQAQVALKESEERFRQLADHIHGVFWMSNVDKSKIFYVSRAFEEIWGLHCSDLYASPAAWMDAIHPEDRDRVRDINAKTLATGTYDEIYRIIRPDGSVRWVEDRAFPIRDADGNIYRIAGIADDITKRKQAWDSLGESEARKQAIMQAALDSIITIDHQGRIIEVNSATERMFALGQAKLIGENIIELVPVAFRSWFQEGLANAFAGDKGPIQGSRIEMPAIRSDGSQFSAEITVSPITLAGHPMFTFYIRDITQRKHAEAEMRSLPQRIIKAQEAERSRIAQELHDGINQLVASVKMRLRKVESALPDLKPAAREILRRCDSLLVKVLEENRRIAHNLRPIELDNLGLAAACASFCQDVQARSDLRIQCRLIPATRRLPSAIELHLFRIVQEAINNIVKHAKAAVVKVELRTRSGSVILKIQDDGQGFDPKATKPANKTLGGLGLTNIRQRALSMEGTCEIVSRPGSGTTITVTAPLGPLKKAPRSHSHKPEAVTD
jgi:PAS domain S-box-containing protein